MWCYNNNNVFVMGAWEIGFIVKSTHHLRLYHDNSVNPTFIISRKNLLIELSYCQHQVACVPATQFRLNIYLPRPAKYLHLKIYMWNILSNRVKKIISEFWILSSEFFWKTEHKCTTHILINRGNPNGGWYSVDGR